MSAVCFAPADVGALLRRAAARADVAMPAIAARAGLRALTDAARAEDLLAGLLADAAREAAHGAAIRLEADEDDARVTLSITVRGRLALAGDRFAQARTAAAALGASLETWADGEATVFRIGLRAAPAAASAPADVAEQAGRRVVLYVEDNPSNRRLVETVLRKEHDLQLVTATDGTAGLALARRSPPAAILTDINIPGLDGYELLRALRSRPETSAIPVLAISAEAMPADVERALAAGFSDYVRKPFKPQELIAALRRALA